MALQTSIRLDPRDPLLPWHLNRMAIAHYFARDYEAAVNAARRQIHLYPGLTADLSLARRVTRPVRTRGRGGRCPKQGNHRRRGSFDMYVRERVPWHRAENYEHMLEGLREAGWRE